MALIGIVAKYGPEPHERWRGAIGGSQGSTDSRSSWCCSRNGNKTTGRN